MSTDRNIAVIGLGYVGLPLAVALAKYMPVVGFDINQKRIAELQEHRDSFDEVFPEEFENTNIKFTCQDSALTDSNFFIVTVPTPVDSNNRPCLKALISASQIVGKNLKQGDIVVYESTVYPGCTEDDCAPILEKYSGLKSGVDFKIGYSPERINPSDHVHTIDKVIKIVSAQDQESLDVVSDVYGKVVKAGLHKAKSIKVAEAAKVVENTQRDLNIAFMNELAKVFDKLGIDTNEVIDAAATKWNFVSMRPGLVGGHCIGVDPYYLIDKANKHNYSLDIVKAARSVNDGMGDFVIGKALEELQKFNISKNIARIAVLGITFKENCHDIRNSRAVEIVNSLKQLDCDVVVHDPLVDVEYAKVTSGIELVKWNEVNDVDAIIITTAHDYYKELTIQDYLAKFKQDIIFDGSIKPIILDVRGILNKAECLESRVNYWRL